MKYALGLFLFCLSFNVLPKGQSAQLLLRARVPASFKVEIEPKKKNGKIHHLVSSNIQQQHSGIKTKFQRYKNHHIVSIIHP